MTLLRISAILLALAITAEGEEFDRKENMKTIKENFVNLKSYTKNDFKNKKKLEQIFENINKIHQSGYSLLANEEEYKNDDEFLKLTSDLIGYNRLAKDSVLKKDHKTFEKSLELIENSCKNCHKCYKK